MAALPASGAGRHRVGGVRHLSVRGAGRPLGHAAAAPADAAGAGHVGCAVLAAGGCGVAAVRRGGDRIVHQPAAAAGAAGRDLPCAVQQSRDECRDLAGAGGDAGAVRAQPCGTARRGGRSRSGLVHARSGRDAARHARLDVWRLALGRVSPDVQPVCGAGGDQPVAGGAGVAAQARHRGGRLCGFPAARSGLRLCARAGGDGAVGRR